jgi:hypothetical protein
VRDRNGERGPFGKDICKLDYTGTRFERRGEGWVYTLSTHGYTVGSPTLICRQGRGDQGDFGLCSGICKGLPVLYSRKANTPHQSGLFPFAPA